MKSLIVWSSTDAVADAATEYMVPGTDCRQSATESSARVRMPTAGTMSELRVYLEDSPGTGGDNYVFTIRKNGSDTSLTATVTNAEVSAEDLSNTVTFAAGDYLTLSWTNNGGNTGSNGRGISVVYTSTTDNEQPLMGATGVVMDNGNTEYVPGVGRAAPGTDEDDHEFVCPTAGTFSDFYVNLSAAPSTLDSYAFTFRKNGSSTALTTTISDTDTEGSDTSNSFSVVAGDVVCIQIVPTSSPDEVIGFFGWQWTPDVADESIVVGVGASAASDEYLGLFGAHNTNPSNSSEHNVPLPEGIFSDLYAAVEFAPGTGSDAWNFMLQINGSSGSLNAEILTTATTGNDTTNSTGAINGQRAGMYVDETGSNANSGSFAYGMIWKPLGEVSNMVSPIIFQDDGATVADAATEYFGPIMQSQASTDESVWLFPVAAACRISSLFVETENAPGTGGDNYVFTVRKNGADTDVTATITATATTGSDTSNSVDFGAGDHISMSVTNNGGATTIGNIYISLESMVLLEDNGQTIFANPTTLDNSGTEYFSAVGQASTQATETKRQSVCPTAGTISDLYVEIEDVAGSGNTWDFTFRKNAADQTLTTSISGTSQLANSDLVNSFSVAAGDLLSIKVVPTSNPAEERARFSWKFTPDTDNEAIIIGGSMTQVSEGDFYLGPFLDDSGDEETEAEVQCLIPAGTLSDLYVKVVTAPGAGDDWNFKVRTDGVTGALDANIADTDTTGNDTSNSDEFDNGEKFSIFADNSGGADNSNGSGFGVIWMGEYGVSYAESLTETNTWTDVASKSTGRGLTEGSTWTDVISKSTDKALAEASAWTDSVNHYITRLFTEGSTWTDDLVAFRARVKELTEASTWTDGLSRYVTRLLTEASTWTDSLNQSISRQLTEASTWTDSVSHLLTRSRTFVETNTWTDAISNALIRGRTLTETNTWTDSLSRYMTRLFTETSTHTDVTSATRTKSQDLTEESDWNASVKINSDNSTNRVGGRGSGINRNAKRGF